MAAISTTAFEVTEAADGLQGFEQATRHPPDLILSDVRVPEPSDPAALVGLLSGVIETVAAA